MQHATVSITDFSNNGTEWNIHKLVLVDKNHISATKTLDRHLSPSLQRQKMTWWKLFKVRVIKIQLNFNFSNLIPFLRLIFKYYWWKKYSNQWRKVGCWWVIFTIFTSTALSSDFCWAKWRQTQNNPRRSTIFGWYF